MYIGEFDGFGRNPIFIHSAKIGNFDVSCEIVQNHLKAIEKSPFVKFAQVPLTPPPAHLPLPYRSLTLSPCRKTRQLILID